MTEERRRTKRRRVRVQRVHRIPKAQLAAASFAEPLTFYWRPKTREDCERVARPCPYVSCRHHLYLDVNPNGNIRYNFPKLEPDEMKDSCSLDVADEHEGGLPLEDMAELLNVTRERARQIESLALAKVEQADAVQDWRHEPDPGFKKRRLPLIEVK